MNVFIDGASINTVISNSNFKNISIIPSSSWLINIEKTLANGVGAETIFKQRLQALSPEIWDYILIDCPPTLGILTINALTACQEVIVPVEARIMAVAGLVQLLQTVDIVKNRLNSVLKIAGILMCRVDVRTRHSREVLRRIKNKFQALVYKTVIRENIRLSEAPSFAKPIIHYDPLSNGALDYRDLATEIISQEISYNCKTGNPSTINISRDSI